MSNKPFRFSISSYGAPSGEAWLAKARRAEELGYDALYVPDHFIGQVSPIPALAAAAAATTRLRLGTIVLANPFRHPILLAKEAATLDWLSNGRFELGLGAGWLQGEYDATGITFAPAAERVSQLIEAVQVIKAYFGPAPVLFDGHYYKIDSRLGLDQIPAAVQRPHPPILIGAASPRLLKFAAREADAISITFKARPDGAGVAELVSEAMFNLKVETIRKAAGSRFDQIELNVVTWGVYITNNIMEVADKLSKDFQIPPAAALAMPYALAGTVEQIAGKINVCRSRYGLTHFTIWDRDMEAFAPVMARLR
jgi:probable F420-dependent oxidoreductase